MRKFLFPLLVFVVVSCAPKTTEKEDKSWQFYYDLGMSSYQAKNFSEAIANFHRALKVNPTEPQIWNALGLVYMEAKEYQKAEESFNKALGLDPNFSEARMNLGILYAKQGKYDLALKYLTEAANDELFAKKHIAYYNLAKVYKALGKDSEYIFHLEKAVNYNPLYVEAQLELAEAYKESKEYEKALKVYELLVNNGYEDPYILYKLAEAYYLVGDYANARAIIRRLLYDYKLAEDQKQKVNDLLTQVLLAQQGRVISFEKPPKKEESKTKESNEETESKDSQNQSKETGNYYIQLGAFSARERAETLVETLKARGLDELKIIETQGVYKVLHGGFKTLEEARKAKEELKKLNIYGFIVEIR